MTQKEAETTEVNCTPPEVKVSGVVSVTSSQQACLRLADMEHTSLRVVSIGALGCCSGNPVIEVPSPTSGPPIGIGVVSEEMPATREDGDMGNQRKLKSNYLPTALLKLTKKRMNFPTSEVPVEALRAGLPGAADGSGEHAHGRAPSAAAAAPVEMLRHPLRQRDGDGHGLVELSPPGLDGDDGGDGAALHQDVLDHLVLDVLRADADLAVLGQGPGQQQQDKVHKSVS